MAGKAEIIESLIEEVDGLSKSQAGAAIDVVFEAIGTHLESGDRVMIPGFGSFSVSERAARQGRNPATGETITIPASRVARFKPGKDLKERLNS